MSTPKKPVSQLLVDQEIITPAIAQLYLTHNHTNRNLRRY